MPAYRLYLLDGTGKVASAEWLEAADDDSAITAVKARSTARRWELWQRQRLVAEIPANGADEGRGA